MQWIKKKALNSAELKAMRIIGGHIMNPMNKD